MCGPGLTRDARAPTGAPGAGCTLDSASFFVTFWSLSLYDIVVPTERYKEQAAKLRAAARELETRAPEGRANREAAQKTRREVERYRSQADKLEQELKEHTEHVARVRTHLDAARHHWFRGATRDAQRRLPARGGRGLTNAVVVQGCGDAARRMETHRPGSRHHPPLRAAARGAVDRGRHLFGALCAAGARVGRAQLFVLVLFRQDARGRVVHGVFVHRE